MNFENNRELAENKLILLFFIDNIEIPITNLQLTKIILENRFMNYFFLQQYLNELCESNFIECTEQEGKTLYRITKYGKQALTYFVNHIPVGIRARIEDTSSSIRKNIKNETLITADFTPISENEYIVSCKVHEDNFSLIDVQITVGTRSDARNVCDNWQNHSQKIYAEIIESLIKKRNEAK